MEALAQTTGIAESALRLLVGLLACYPFSIVFKLLPDKQEWLKHVYCALCGLSLAIFCYSTDAIHSFLSILITYIVLWMFQKHRSIGVALAFVGNMGHLLGSYWLVSTEKYDLNYTTAQCVLTLRLIGFAWDFFDGSRDPKKLEHDQRENGLAVLPPLYQFFGFNYFYGGFLTGPQFTFRVYKRFITKENFSNPKKNDQATSTAVQKPEQPSAVGPAFQRFFLGLAYLLIHNGAALVFPSSLLTTKAFLEGSSFFERMITILIVCKIALMKYVGVWLIAEGSCILCGLGFAGYDEKGKPRWDAVANVRPYQLETGTTLQSMVDSFNINTNDWVKRYVFKRLKFLNNRDLSALGALFFLAIWHGFNPGYFLCFSLEFFDMECEKKLRRIVQPLTNYLYNNKNPLRFLFSLLCYFLSTMAVTYALTSFEVKSWEASRNIFNSVYWVGHLAIPLIYILDLLVPRSKAPTSASNNSASAVPKTRTE
jgi:lysophospholipid acyltransferase 5